jgi:conjugal transfer/type IV secretion protein DotA/TraY
MSGTLKANARHALALIARPLRLVLGAMFNLNFRRSMLPFAVSYYSFGRLLADFFQRLGLIDKAHPWFAGTLLVRPVEVLAYANARVNWAKPFAMPAVITASVTLLLTCAVLASTSLGVTTLLGAGQAYAGSFFTPTNPATDLGLKYMSNSFGVAIPGVPMGAVDALVGGFHRIMALYSSAMLVIAGFVLIYIILSVITSTAHEGRFGGSSFHQIWSPLRLIVAIGLLVPLPMAGGYNGYNSGQYIVLKLSEWGSGLATNLWVPFATSLANRGDVIATPGVPSSAAEAVRGTLLAEFCMNRYNFISTDLGLGMPPVTVTSPPTTNGRTTLYYGAGTGAALNNYCGTVSYEKSIAPGILATQISNGYETAFNNMRLAVSTVAATLNSANYIHPYEATSIGNIDAIKNYVGPQLATIITNYQNELATVISGTTAAQSTSATDAMTTAIQDSGWAGAGMWFNTIARLNAEVMSAARGIPAVQAPTFAGAAKADAPVEASLIDNKVQQGYNMLKEVLADPAGLFAATGVSSTMGAGNVAGVYTPAVTLGLENTSGDTFTASSSRIGEYISKIMSKVPGSPFDQIGTGPDTGISQINPLAQLSAIGNFMMGFAAASIGIAILPLTPTAIMFVLVALASMMFGAGVLLFYVTPLMPFIRLLFGVAGWLLNILEAIIAIPLIALAHLNTRGEGISGDMARTGYMMIFSIFLRPALLIVGMVTALMMFIITIGILNDSFQSAVVGLLGPQAARGGLSVIFYTVMYAVLAFGLCNLCFKLIEEIPNRAMSWIGQASSREITEDDRVAKVLSSTSENFIGIGRSISSNRGAPNARQLPKG